MVMYLEKSLAEVMYLEKSLAEGMYLEKSLAEVMYLEKSLVEVMYLEKSLAEVMYLEKSLVKMMNPYLALMNQSYYLLYFLFLFYLKDHLLLYQYFLHRKCCLIVHKRSLRNDDCHLQTLIKLNYTLLKIAIAFSYFYLD